jgi:hypothetical protein
VQTQIEKTCEVNQPKGGENMKTLNKLMLLSAILGLALGWSMCADYSNDDSGGNNHALTGSMSFYLETADDDVGGFYFEVRDPAGALVDSRYAPLEDMNFPSRLLEGAGSNHKFADAYFVLEPGDYIAQAFPMIEEGVRSEVCDPSDPVRTTVNPGETTEVILVSQCEAVDNGGLDIVVIINHEPRILDLVFDPSKFVPTCEELAVTVTAEDPDDDPLTYSWAITSAPQGANYTSNPDGDTLYFTARTDGDYEAEVTVCDSLGLCTQLSFPIHVVLSDTECSQCDEGRICGEYISHECQCGIDGMCALTAEGDGECMDGWTPCSGLPDCTSSSDCPNGGRCLVETCCRRPVCIAPPNLCYLPDARKSQSTRGDGQRIGFE